MMKKQSILVGVLSLSAYAMGTTTSFATVKTTTATTIEATCGDKKAEAKTTFICPMHSDITSDKAGKCSKCGMNLVEKKTK
jgi:hypothetical protein